MMNVTSHPLKGPSLGVPVEARNVESCIKLEYELLILVLLVRDKGQQSNISEAFHRLIQTRKSRHGFMIQTPMRVNPVLVVEDTHVVASLMMSPKPI